MAILLRQGVLDRMILYHHILFSYVQEAFLHYLRIWSIRILLMGYQSVEGAHILLICFFVDDSILFYRAT